MAGKVSVSSGLVPFEIYFEDRKKSITIYFNPTDPLLPQRLLDVEKRIAEKLDKLSYKPEGKVDAAAYIKAIDEMNQVVCSEVDYAFGNAVSGAVFQFCAPLTIIGGKYFVTIFLEAITPRITMTIDKENKNFIEYIEEYIND